MQDPGSLENLRDIVELGPVLWWPPAVGWWIVFAFVVIAGLITAARQWRRWRANRYRRVALVELEMATDDATVVELLKRTAICASGRTEVGSLSGWDWCQWLAASGETPLPDDVAQRITTGVYRDGSQRTPALAEFARTWISCHSVSSTQSQV